MADNSTKTGAVLTWIAGIAATVIASVLIYYFTRPAPVTQVGLDGFVADTISHKPVPDAMVTANLGATLATQTTDSEGRYSFIMNTTTPPPANLSISVNVLAGGYQPYTSTVPLTSNDTLAELPIQPVAVPALPGHPVAAAPAATPAKAIPILHLPTSFKKRNESIALKAK